MVVFMFALHVPRKITNWFSTGGIFRLSSADPAVRDMNENSRCVYPLGDKAIRVVHTVVSLDRKLNADSNGVNALKRLKHLPSKWSWIRTLSNEVWG